MITHSVKRLLRSALSLCLAVVLVVPSARTACAGEISGLNTAQRHIVCTGLSEAAQAYYTGDYSIDTLLSLQGAADASNSYAAAQGNQLYAALQTLMQSTLDRGSLPVYSGFAPNSLATYWSLTDTSPDVDNSKSSHFLMFYSDAVYEYPGNTVTMNREHIWPKSHASFHEANGGSDLHHLRPAVSTLNDAKSDHKFGYVDEVYAAGYDVGSLNSAEVYKAYADKDVFEPKDDVKGDVARILLYVYCCWGQPNLYSDVDTANLPAPDPGDVTNTGGRVITDLDTLLTWCEDDPVDTWEMQRNDLTEELQGNRNVFIDYPELAWRLFGRDIPPGIQTPTRAGCAHSWGEESVVSGGCLETGTAQKTCSICGNVHVVPTPARGHIDEDENHRCDVCDEKLLGTYTLADQPVDGDHILLYHPASGKAPTKTVNSSGRLNSVSVVENDGAIVPDPETAIFHLEAAEGGGFHLVNGGKYLTTPQKGGKLLWSDTIDDYATWDFFEADEGGFFIINRRAGNSYGRSGIEFFNNAFTTYSASETDAFRFLIYSSPDHAWERISVVEPTTTEPGEITYKCAACGETMTEEIPVIPTTSVTVTMPESVEISDDEAQKTFDILTEAAIFGPACTGIEIRLYDSVFTSEESEGTIPFAVTTDGSEAESFEGDDGKGQKFIIRSDTALPYSCQGVIGISDDDLEAAQPGLYTAVLAWKAVSPSEDGVTLPSGTIALTLTVPEPPEPVTYSVTKGDGSQWTKGSSETLDFTFERSAEDETTFDRFTGIKVDGSSVSDYDASAGSVNIKLKPAYLEALAVGSHTLEAVFEDGSAEAAFTVLAKEENKDPVTPTPTPITPTLVTPTPAAGHPAVTTPAAGHPASSTPTPASTQSAKETSSARTGDESHPVWWLLLAAGSLCLLYMAKRRRSRHV